MEKSRIAFIAAALVALVLAWYMLRLPEANEAAWRKRENQLERQRLLWQIVSVLAICGGAAIAA